MDVDLARLSLENREQEGWDVTEGDSGYEPTSYKLCLVGRFFTASISKWLQEDVEIKGTNFVSSNLGNEFSKELDLEDRFVNQISTNLGLHMGGANGLGINGGILIDTKYEDCRLESTKEKKK
ncbi:hypothetical protein Goari_020822, partial [Gossypium aridum]|nr:hypothetical protein [Gossypium aridum]